MNRVDNVKKAIKIVTFSVLGLALLVTVLFIIHVINISNENGEWNTVTPGSSVTQALLDIHPRGGSSGSWPKAKADTGFDSDMFGTIFDLTVTNNSHYYIEDWNLRINLKEDCYINNGWNGEFEIHQIDDEGSDVSQTLSFADVKADDLKLKFYQANQDLLIPLKRGDYIMYYPTSDETYSEVPIRGSEDYSGTCTCGIIMYNISGNIDFSDSVLSYRIYRSIWDGTKGTLFIVAFALLVISFLIIGTIFMVSVHFEGRLESKGRMLTDVFSVCCSLADSKDYYSKGHSKRVADYSRMIAEKMGMDKSDCDIVYNAALLHNVGNVFIDEQILRKTTKLTSTEYAEVKAHTTHGAEILKEIESIPMAFEAALFHHERYDGKGYPNGKKEDEIPLIARIVAVADAYDAMSNDRPYRNKLMREQIREELINNRGQQFDPEIVTAFLDIMGEKNL
ncbi:MAG: HD-GYP domain-containing protein [Lachnospiraceae bacterium]|nr:HD-GYP domain-containing protein [Lachnospiraceae bacterium]